MGVHLLTGDDESLLNAAVGELVHRLVGDSDRTLMVDDLDGENYEVRQLVDAAQTPPFLTDRRVVVGRSIGRFTGEDVAALTAYLSDPLPSTDLVLVAGGGRIVKAVTDAVKAAGGHVVATGAPVGRKERTGWVEEQLAAAGVRLDGAAFALLADWLGEDAGRLRSVSETLVATYGADRRLSAADIAPFLGEAGGIPPWDLTDAIDRGDAAGALTSLGRMMRGGERHPLQVMAILHGHVVRLAKLDGSGVRGEQEAASLLGVKSGFQAKKALDQHRRLGSDGVRRSMQLLAQADADLRGARDVPADTVMEILVARLARLVPAGSRRR